MDSETKREKSVAINGLGCLVQALKGMRLTVDLRNESSVTGLAKEMDGFMNIVMENAVFEDSEGTTYQYDTIYLKNRNIRYIHIPKHVCVRDTIVTHLNRILGKQAVKKTSALERYRTDRLQQRQEETRALVEKLKKAREEPSTSESK